MIHNGKYTIKSPSGEHRTFDISTQPDDATFAPGKRVISLLVGQDNEHSYQGFGFVTDQGICVWSRLRGDSPQEPSFHEKCAKMIWSLVEDGESSLYLAKGVTLHLEKHCLRCNRTLTTPESIERGIGPECARIMGLM